MRLIDADNLEKEGWALYRNYQDSPTTWIYETKKIDSIPTVDAVEVVRCENCEHFDLNHWENFRGFPLIVAHEICNRWGSGCKTDSHGFCFLGDRKNDE